MATRLKMTRNRCFAPMVAAVLMVFSGTSYGLGLGLVVEDDTIGITVKEKTRGTALGANVSLLKQGPEATSKIVRVSGGVTKHYKKYLYYGAGLGTQFEIEGEEGSSSTSTSNEDEGFDIQKMLEKVDARLHLGGRFIVKRKIELFGEFIVKSKLDMDFNFSESLAFGARYKF